MMSIEEFLRREQPKVKVEIFASHEFRRKTVRFEDSNWRQWFDSTIETVLCYLRDSGNTHGIITNNIGHVEGKTVIDCKFSIEAMGIIAGYLRGRGFIVREYLSVFNKDGYGPYIDVRWDGK